MGRIELLIDDDLRLLQYIPADAEAIFALIDRNREHLSQYDDMTAKKYATAESVLESITNPPNSERLRFGIWTDVLAGTVNITPGASFAEIGYYLGREFEGCGYVTRAVKRLLQYGREELDLIEACAHVHKNNSPSIAVLERIGFTEVEHEEGTPLREYVFPPPK